MRRHIREYITPRRPDEMGALTIQIELGSVFLGVALIAKSRLLLHRHEMRRPARPVIEQSRSHVVTSSRRHVVTQLVDDAPPQRHPVAPRRPAQTTPVPARWSTRSATNC